MLLLQLHHMLMLLQLLLLLLVCRKDMRELQQGHREHDLDGHDHLSPLPL